MKMLLINLGVLICAISVFTGSLAYTAKQIPAEPELPVEKLVKTGENEFWQDDDLLITDLMDEEEIPLNELRDEDGDLIFEGASSTAESSSSAAPSSEPPKPVSSAPPPPSSSAPSSAPPPPPSSVEPVSEAPSSEEPVSEALTEEPSEKPPISGDYAGILDTLAGAVQREIIGTNTEPKAHFYEAYKAQAVASHSYMEYHRARTGSYPVMSYSTPKQATVNLVAEVLNELIYDQNGNVINASYHAASGGGTQSAYYVWGNQVSYLTAAQSSYDDYQKTTSMAAWEVEQKLNLNGISTSGDPSTWFDLASATLTDGGFVETIPICGQYVKGRTLRETILGVANLKSPKIIDIQVSNDTFYFTTKGWGHGVGLSQEGALGYAANEGFSYRDILTHYYSGVTVQ